MCNIMFDCVFIFRTCSLMCCIDMCSRWVRMNIPLVNPTAETLELNVSNTNPRNYKLEMNSADTVCPIHFFFFTISLLSSPSMFCHNVLLHGFFCVCVYLSSCWRHIRLPMLVFSFVHPPLEKKTTTEKSL